jgi:hypothetical protein
LHTHIMFHGSRISEKWPQDVEWVKKYKTIKNIKIVSSCKTFKCFR